MNSVREARHQGAPVKPWRGRCRGRGFGLVGLSALFLTAQEVGLFFGLIALDVARPLAIAMMAVAFPVIAVLAIRGARLLLFCILRPISTDIWRQPLCDLPPLVVPVIIRRPEDIEAIRYSADENLRFIVRRPMVFLVDLPDSPVDEHPRDQELIASLTRRMSDHFSNGSVVCLFRRRMFDPVDDVWRGWERKRGKLEEFCRLLLGDGSTSFCCDLPRQLDGVEAFVTIDVDTVLTPDAISRLMKCADREAAIVAPMLDDRCRPGASVFERLVEIASRRHSVDPNLNFNQSRLGYDLYYGKGLVFPDRFLSRTSGKIEERTVLSHDHLESMLAGSVSCSNAIVEEMIPQDRAQWARRQFRWTRGDLQILPWVFAKNLPLIQRFHLFEVALNHAVNPCCLTFSVIAVWLLSWPVSLLMTALCLMMLRPALLFLPAIVLSILLDFGIVWGHRWRLARSVVATEVAAWVLSVVYAPGDMFLSMRAAILVAWRLGWSGRNLLQWEGEAERRQGISGAATRVAVQMLMGGAALIVAFGASDAIRFAFGLLAIWLMGPRLLALRPSFHEISAPETGECDAHSAVHHSKRSKQTI